MNFALHMTRSDLESIPKADWVVIAPNLPFNWLNHSSSSLQLMENNLVGTLNLIEYCKRQCRSYLANQSRVSTAELSVFQSLKKKPDFPWCSIEAKDLKKGSPKNFQQPPCPFMEPPNLLRTMALEYGLNFNFRLDWRCGVMAETGQFGKADQGIISYWIHSFREAKPLIHWIRRQWVASQGSIARRCSWFANAKSDKMLPPL